jgi:hypothetical protein
VIFFKKPLKLNHNILIISTIDLFYIKYTQQCQKKIKFILTWSLLVTSTLENQPQLVISSTNVVVLIRELSKSLRKKLLIWENHPSNTHGLWINLNHKEKEVLPLISLFGNSKLLNIISPSLMPQDTEISSRTWSLVLPKLIAPFLWLPHLKVNSKLVFPNKDKPENMPFFPSLWVLNKWSFAKTKLIKRLSTILKKDITKSKKKSLIS